MSRYIFALVLAVGIFGTQFASAARQQDNCTPFLQDISAEDNPMYSESFDQGADSRYSDSRDGGRGSRAFSEGYGDDSRFSESGGADVGYEP